MRKLPVYLLIDTSSSMMHEPIEAVNNGLQALVSELRQDPQALETAFLSIITFDSEAKQIMPLTELASIQIPNLVAKGVTEMGAALSLVAEKIENEVTKTTPDTKGDWKPYIFLMTDGLPTDDLQKGIDRLNQVKNKMVVACAVGQNSDEGQLKSITEIVVKLETADSATITAYLKWVSQSITVGSQQADRGQGDDIRAIEDLPPPPKEVNLVL